jgi:hypothetical protein
MSRVRARFIAGHLSAEPFERVMAEFRRRDSVLKAFRRRKEVTLWFEHDLYDQLQLVQLLHWFALRQPAGTRLKLICIAEFPGVERFRGLGELTPSQIAALYDGRKEIPPEQLKLGDRGWEAFSSDRPLRLQELMREDLSLLPYLRPALLRHMEQYPSTRDGLSRSERQILETVGAGVNELGAAYRVSHVDREERPFMGDWPFLLHVRYLCDGTEPLLEFEDGRRLSRADGPPHAEEFWKRRVRTTEPGRKVISGQVDRLRYQSIDRWLGGVHLQGEPAWRWGHRRRELVAQRGRS